MGAREVRETLPGQCSGIGHTTVILARNRQRWQAIFACIRDKTIETFRIAYSVNFAFKLRDSAGFGPVGGG